jgi:diaminopimelate epimerase
MKFSKYHALGNDYLVIDPKDINLHDLDRTKSQTLTCQAIQTLCDRHYGIGSDGVLYGPLQSANNDFSLRIFNPDGSEAEKSGNGLRIFSRYLFDAGLVGNRPFSIETKGGTVYATVFNSGAIVSVDMGRVMFSHDHTGALWPQPEPELISAKGERFEYYRASVGNPHCVIPVKKLSPSLAKTYGPGIERDPSFVNQTNVQFMQVIDKSNIAIEIWERGAGYTLASGSSSTAAAAVAYGLGLCGAELCVHMPGGVIEISFTEQFQACMTGPVSKIAVGELAEEALKQQPIRLK